MFRNLQSSQVRELFEDIENCLILKGKVGSEEKGDVTITFTSEEICGFVKALKDRLLENDER